MTDTQETVAKLAKLPSWAFYAVVGLFAVLWAIDDRSNPSFTHGALFPLFFGGMWFIYSLCREVDRLRRQLDELQRAPDDRAV